MAPRKRRHDEGQQGKGYEEGEVVADALKQAEYQLDDEGRRKEQQPDGRNSSVEVSGPPPDPLLCSSCSLDHCVVVSLTESRPGTVTNTVTN